MLDNSVSTGAPHSIPWQQHLTAPPREHFAAPQWEPLRGRRRGGWGDGPVADGRDVLDHDDVVRVLAGRVEQRVRRNLAGNGRVDQPGHSREREREREREIDRERERG